MYVLNEFKEKFKVNEYKIHESEYWIWSLRPHQATIGAGILSLRRECLNFSELKPEEFTDLNNIIKIIETTLKKAFDYDVINYLMLMMFDKHVHFHIFPRYEKSVEVMSKTWEDKNWPAIPTLVGESLQKTEMEEILLLIKKNI